MPGKKPRNGHISPTHVPFAPKPRNPGPPAESSMRTSRAKKRSKR